MELALFCVSIWSVWYFQSFLFSDWFSIKNDNKNIKAVWFIGHLNKLFLLSPRILIRYFILNKDQKYCLSSNNPSLAAYDSVFSTDFSNQLFSLSFMLFSFFFYSDLHNFVIEKKIIWKKHNQNYVFLLFTDKHESFCQDDETFTKEKKCPNVDMFLLLKKY